MCGRFKLQASWSEIHRLYQLTLNLNLRPRYNIAPSQGVLAVRYNAETHQRIASELRWGLIPFWAKEASIGYKMINAKAEGISEKPSFREAFKSRRCIIPADGFYEWKATGAKMKQPYAIVMQDRSVFGFAGLWERWRDKANGGEVVESCTIITTEPNAVCAPIHNRMPVILPPESYATWLGEREAGADELLALLKPYPAEKMTAFPIGPRIGNVKNEGPELLEALT